MIKFWKRLKYWQKGGIICVLFIFLLSLLLGFNAMWDSWDKIYQNGQFHCQDFKGFNWTPCSLFDVIEQQILAPLFMVFSLPLLLVFAFFEIPIKSDIIVYTLLIISLLVGISIYFSIGALIAIIIRKIRKRRWLPLHLQPDTYHQ